MSHDCILHKYFDTEFKSLSVKQHSISQASLPIVEAIVTERFPSRVFQRA